MTAPTSIALTATQQPTRCVLQFSIEADTYVCVWKRGEEWRLWLTLARWACDSRLNLTIRDACWLAWQMAK